MKKIIYQPLSITSKRRKFLESEGYEVLDIRFAPAGYNAPDVKEPLPKKKPSAKVSKS